MHQASRMARESCSKACSAVSIHRILKEHRACALGLKRVDNATVELHMTELNLLTSGLVYYNCWAHGTRARIKHSLPSVRCPGQLHTLSTPSGVEPSLPPELARVGTRPRSQLAAYWPRPSRRVASCSKSVSTALGGSCT